MNELMRRRRALIGQKKRASDILFLISNYSVTAGDTISSGIKAFDADTAVTILLDFTLTQRPASGNGATFRLIYADQNVFMFGPRDATAVRAYFYWFDRGTYTDAKVDFANGSRYRICLTHSANSNYVYVKTKKDSGTLNSMSATKSFSASSYVLRFGWPNGTNGLPNGTINSAVVYNRVLSADEINNFFS